VYAYEAPGNGSGPLWCHGSTCIARLGDEVFASGIETIPGAKPLNNVRWTLYRLGKDGWKLWRKDEADRTREPSPLAVFPGGRVFLSANPTLAPPDSYSGPAEPRVLEFQAGDPEAKPAARIPVWTGRPDFTEHSYRSFAADGPRRELILFQNVGYTHAEWTLFDREGVWSAQGKLFWPWGAEYPKPGPIRVCYPAVALRDRAVHFAGVSDIQEPYPEWRAYKRALTGSEWDYDFRRLFYTWTDEVGRKEFSPWVEISSRDKTCGWIFPRDLWLDAGGAAHLLWSERAIDERLREKFFPSAKQTISLAYAVVRGGAVVLRKAVAEAEEPLLGEIPGAGRFHATEAGRLFVVYHVTGKSPDGARLFENRIVEVRGGSIGRPARIPLSAPLANFFTATPRAGSAPSSTIDLLGEGEKPGAIRYARIRIVR
ncbi:MAG: hypothetical protein ACUVYA_13920, partial [Planctomycetota bacterium]